MRLHDPALAAEAAEATEYWRGEQYSYYQESFGHECNPYCRGCNICEEVDEEGGGEK